MLCDELELIDVISELIELRSVLARNYEPLATVF